MVAVPAVIPLTIPVAGLTVAVVVALLLHVPPVVAVTSSVVLPVHRVAVPLMGDGKAYTVTVLVAVQPMPSE
jgi:hypothetical protein